jgi:3-hydroxyacyl-CoA dehydrogenase
MGAQIAGHVANAGVPVLLFDLTADAARKGLERLRSIRPDPLFTPDVVRLIEPRGFDQLADVARADWIIEAVVEQLDVKRDLLRRVLTHASPLAALSSNTSGIPIGAIAAEMPPEARTRLLGTHFFNPPRYLRLVEIIATPDTDADVVATLARFIDHHLGKGVVAARDTPGFIANRLGVFGACRALELIASGEFTIEEIDAATGPAIGRPKSATFRTLDIAGLDILALVARDLAARLPDRERASFALPPFVTAMVERGLVGEKAGRGFYMKTKDAKGESRVLTLDIERLDYRDPSPAKFAALEATRPSAPPDRIRSLFLSRDRLGDLLRRTLGTTLVYAATVAHEIAASPDDVDRAMRWGYGWELGPFEIWDAIGVKNVLEACAVSDPPSAVRRLFDAGRDRFRNAALPPAGPGLLVLQSAKTTGVIKKNAGASLVDLGEGVLCVELHSKMNTIGGDTIEMIRAGLAESAKQTALVIGGEADLFSAGANVMLLLLEAQEGNWDEVDRMVREFQRMSMAIKTSPVPVVVAPAGLALGGGCEICLHADRIQASAETYIGLVEVGVGLLPAGGGTKEMLLRALDRAAGVDPAPHVRAAFETIALGKVSTSAPDARRLGYLREVDEVTMNRERTIADAKAVAIIRARDYQPSARRTAIPVGGADLFALLSLGVHLAWRAGQATDHDALVSRAVARVLTGGDIAHKTTVSEDYLLDLEREAFLKLCGERKTLERIGYTLKTGRQLRN